MTCCSSNAPLAINPLFTQGMPSLPGHARDLEIIEIGMRLARDLNATWHSMLPRTDLGNLLCGNMSVAFGAVYQEYWYGVAIYSQPIIASLCDGRTIELRRLAICDTAPYNTATRMMGVTRRLVKTKWPNLSRVVSYQAIDVHCGTIYKADNWMPMGKIVAARPQRLSGSKQRATGPLQTTSRKVRWEHDL